MLPPFSGQLRCLWAGWVLVVVPINACFISTCAPVDTIYSLVNVCCCCCQALGPYAAFLPNACCAPCRGTMQHCWHQCLGTRWLAQPPLRPASLGRSKSVCLHVVTAVVAAQCQGRMHNARRAGLCIDCAQCTADLWLTQLPFLAGGNRPRTLYNSAHRAGSISHIHACS